MLLMVFWEAGWQYVDIDEENDWEPLRESFQYKYAILLA